LAAFAAASGALAHDKDKDKVIKVEKKKTCVCSFDGAGGPEGFPVPPPPPGAPVPPHGATWEMQLPEGEGDVKIYRHKGGAPGEQRMFVYKIRTRDDADTNKDGRITRKEFEKEAQRRFKELDRDDDGVLDRSEAQPPMPPMPPLPPMPATPAVPPAPPMPPVPPLPADED
jgi:hypothetical protein